MPEDTLPLHVRVRIEQRDAQLERLGYASYRAYLNSDEWAEVKRRYRDAPALPQECFCGETEVEFHHTTYERVGQERPEDLVPLCGKCHQMLHAFERRGDCGLDSMPFVENPMQAFLYRVERMAMVQRAEKEAPDRMERFRQERKERSRARRQRRKKKAA